MTKLVFEQVFYTYQLLQSGPLPPDLTDPSLRRPLARLLLVMSSSLFGRCVLFPAG